MQCASGARALGRTFVSRPARSVCRGPAGRLQVGSALRSRGCRGAESKGSRHDLRQEDVHVGETRYPVANTHAHTSTRANARSESLRRSIGRGVRWVGVVTSGNRVTGAQRCAFGTSTGCAGLAVPRGSPPWPSRSPAPTPRHAPRQVRSRRKREGRQAQGRLMRQREVWGQATPARAAATSRCAAHPYTCTGVVRASFARTPNRVGSAVVTWHRPQNTCCKT